MTAQRFRRIALALDGAIEGAHMGHPDFRVGGKIFATLLPDKNSGMAKLNPEQQAWFLENAAESFTPAPGAWGDRGATLILLSSADETLVQRALNAAWRNTAPKKLVADLDNVL